MINCVFIFTHFDNNKIEKIVHILLYISEMGITMARYDSWVYERGLENEKWVHDRWGYNRSKKHACDGNDDNKTDKQVKKNLDK